MLSASSGSLTRQAAVPWSAYTRQLSPLSKPSPVSELQPASKHAVSSTPPASLRAARRGLVSRSVHYLLTPLGGLMCCSGGLGGGKDEGNYIDITDLLVLPQKEAARR